MCTEISKNSCCIYGIRHGCLGCAAAHFENIEQGAVGHGINVPALMEALNKAVAAEA